jgi:hypothetical protein
MSRDLRTRCTADRASCTANCAPPPSGRRVQARLSLRPPGMTPRTTATAKRGARGVRAHTAWFFGEASIADGRGRPRTPRVTLVERRLEPGRRRVVERVLTREPGGPAREYVAVLRVRGSEFTVRERRGRFEGGGSLRGPRWSWTAWRSETRLARGGLTVRSRARLARGGLHASARVYTPDGRVAVRLSEILHRISHATFELLHACLRSHRRPRRGLRGPRSRRGRSRLSRRPPA